MALEFKSGFQTLGIQRSIEDIFVSNQNDRNIINFAFLKYSAEAISKIAVESYKKDIQSFQAKSVKKRKTKDPISTPPTDVVQPKVSPLDDSSDPQDIFSLSDRNQHLVLQSATLIRGLLQKNFASTAADIQKLQCSDVKKGFIR